MFEGVEAVRGTSRGRIRSWLASLAIAAAVVAVAIGDGTPSRAAEMKPEIAPGTTRVEHDAGVFKDDPSYQNKPYDPQAQIDIYGGKRAIAAPRPLLEAGRPIYTEGPFRPSLNIIGRKNLVDPRLTIFGDWRTAIAYNDNGAKEQALVATRLNLDIDLGLTATERVHAFIRPLDNGGEFTRCILGGDRDTTSANCDIEADANLETLFFEGDMGSIYAGLADEYVSVDLPFAFGLMPMLLQNGIWLEDAFIGAAASIPALNSPTLDISNMDFTLFGGFDKVSTNAILDNFGQRADHDVNIFGVAAFVEANRGYWEAGIGWVDGQDSLDDFSYGSATIAHTRRFGALLSNSIRLIYNFGQDADGQVQTADGAILLIENSLITSKPLTLVPYLNGWIGIDRPMPLARQDGVLKNTGINFETDALTGFPKLDDSGQNTFGAAMGVQYLFDLSKQIVVEAATVQVIEGDNETGRAARGDEYALGLRYQHNLDLAWLFRVDAMYGWRDEDDDLTGFRFELRRKF